MMASTPPTILVVDDDVGILVAMEKRLTRAGYRVLTAATGPDALACARENAVDVMTLDVALGGPFSGLEVAAFLRKDPRISDIPIVFLTSAADSRFEEKCRASGGTYFLSKPFDFNLLLQLLENISAESILAEIRWISSAKRRQPAVRARSF